MSIELGLGLLGGAWVAIEAGRQALKRPTGGGSSSASGLIRTNRRQPQPGWDRNPDPRQYQEPPSAPAPQYEELFKKMPPVPGESVLSWLDRHGTASHGKPNHVHLHGVCTREEDK